MCKNLLKSDKLVHLFKRRFICSEDGCMILYVICLATAASSAQTTSASVSTASQTQLPKEQPESQPELTFSYELQQAYRIFRELTGDCNKSFVGPFVNPIDSSSPDYAEYHKRVKHPMWLKQSKLMKVPGVLSDCKCVVFIPGVVLG